MFAFDVQCVDWLNAKAFIGRQLFARKMENLEEILRVEHTKPYKNDMLFRGKHSFKYKAYKIFYGGPN